MLYSDDRSGSKFIFIAIFIIIVYLAFFHFDISAAYQYTVLQVTEFFNSL